MSNHVQPLLHRQHPKSLQQMFEARPLHITKQCHCWGLEWLLLMSRPVCTTSVTSLFGIKVVYKVTLPYFFFLSSFRLFLSMLDFLVLWLHSLV